MDAPYKGPASQFLSELLQTLTERGRRLLRRSRGAPVARGDLENLANLLLSRKGEASGAALAGALIESYQAATLETRLGFLSVLATEFGPDAGALREAAKTYLEEGGQEAAAILHEAAEPRRQELFRRLNAAPAATHALVKMREDLLAHMSSDPAYRYVDRDFLHLFSSWFNRGFLVLRTINWSTPANILDKIIRYEAVHEIRGWDDLRARVDPADRRCFAFFHPQLLDEPLIFVEVALTRSIPDGIAPLLAQERGHVRAEEATTAVFYSISNTQKGLAGVSFGNFLIKQVVDDLRRELPNLTNFVTLSPVVGFAQWLAAVRSGEVEGPLDAETLDALAMLDDPLWYRDATKRAELAVPLKTAAAFYFLRAKTRRGQPMDPVARFHLGNGARLENIHILGDMSAKGLEQAHGLMVNYLYDRNEIEKNHEAFTGSGEVITSSAIRKLVPQRVPSRSLIP